MPRKSARRIAEEQAARDAALLEEAMAAQQPTEENSEEEYTPTADSESTLADRFVGINELIVNERKRTRLSESTLVKTFETALQYHAWDYQRRAQEAAAHNPFAQMMGNGGGGSGEDESLVGPEPHEIIGPADEDTPDNIVPVDFTPAEETE